MNSTPEHRINSSMIAPCGINCALCMAHLRGKNHCPGCLASDTNKPNYCISCQIKNCKELNLRTRKKYCITCSQYPCPRLKRLHKRYSTKYGVDIYQNLEAIRSDGIRCFIKKEREKWRCPACGGVLCMHRDTCRFCGSPKSKRSIKKR